MFSRKRLTMLTILGVFFLLCFSQHALASGPFGTFATPSDGATVSGVVSLTGWALDDVAVAHVKIYLIAGGSLVYMGDGVFVEGARPDVAHAFPAYPNSQKAGWAYSLVTNFLPDGGNSAYTIQVIATDNEGTQTTLGMKTIHCDNNNAVKPFGDFDTPTPGGIASGSAFRNSGWALTPQPNTIPTDGSTIRFFIDGVYKGNATYNIYRSDIAALLPGYTNSSGAGAYFDFDTTAYPDGVHTIFWTATDNGGNSEGIGSQYFTIQNGPPVTAPVVTTTTITDITGPTASGGGTVTSDGNNPVTARGVCWSEFPHPLASASSPNKTIDGTGTGTFTSALTGLTPGTTYYVRAYAVNSKGTSYGDDVSFPPSSIPTLNEWGMIIMAILLLGFASWMMKRNHQDMM